MRKRFLASLAVFLPLAGCATDFADEQVSAPPGGTGVTVDGTVAGNTVASVSRLPVRNSTGLVEPYGTQG